MRIAFGHGRARIPALVVVPIVVLAAAGAACTVAGRAGGPDDPLCSEIARLPGPAREEARAVTRLLAARPSVAIDLTAKSGEYCLNTGSHVMAHFAARPETSSEDIIYLVDAEPLVARGLRLGDFPALDPDPSKRRPNTWYRYEGRGVEPHHGMEMKDRTWLVLAVDLK
jgi:hypothetical protein